MRFMKKFLSILLLSLLLLPVTVYADQAAPVEIHTVEDLLAVGKNPQGDYILMADLDMTGVEWKSLDFFGTFQGNGHAILNLTLSQPGELRKDSYDGNAKAYETAYVGFFGTLSGATVTDLKLINVRAVVEMDCPVFLAGMAGYMEDSTVSGCTVTGTLELRAHDRMFGVGGIAGYGWGCIENCTADVTLITVDTDTTTKDEQFLGGIYGTGFIDVVNCHVTLAGYISEYGYVHSGGVVGMYMSYPYGNGRHGKLVDTHVKATITFFERNDNRRAYCRGLIGESLINSATISGNTAEFVRDERFEYQRVLRPEMCDNPVYTETVVEAGCSSYGYTRYTCDGCGCSYTDHYTLFAHTVTQWTETVAAALENEGLRTGLCDGCGMEFQEVIPRLEPAPTEAETQPPTEAAQPETVPAEELQPAEKPKNVPWLWLGMGAVPVLVVLFLCGKKKGRAGKYEKA